MFHGGPFPFHQLFQTPEAFRFSGEILDIPPNEEMPASSINNKPPTTMHTNPDHDDRLKLSEAIAATALVVFAAGAIVISFAFLAAQCIFVETIDHLKQKGK
jgi:hypothetical protein